MPTKAQIKAAAAKKAAAKKGTASKKVSTGARAGTAKATAAKTAGGKRESAAVQNEVAMKKVVAMRAKGTPWSEIASAISTTPGKAQFLMMLHRVAEGEVPTISTAGNEEAVAKRINAARIKADDHSSWGWLAARTGWSEGRIKTLLEAQGMYSPRETNIAAVRAGTNETTPSGARKKSGGGTATASKKTTAKKPAKKAAQARAKARARRSNPSK